MLTHGSLELIQGRSGTVVTGWMRVPRSRNQSIAPSVCCDERVKEVEASFQGGKKS